MRIVLALPILLASAACNVSRDDANDSMTVQYDQNTAENAAADIGNFAENVGGAIANDVQSTADKVQNTDVNVDVDTNVQTNSH
jgi:hypothetical protein